MQECDDVRHNVLAVAVSGRIGSVFIFAVVAKLLDPSLLSCPAVLCGSGKFSILQDPNRFLSLGRFKIRVQERS